MEAGLSKRDRTVLQSLVQTYVVTAAPVGSRTICRRYHLGLSPATVRNTMMDLEEMGYLWQPHTSAGRVPTDKGYRFYVDTLMSLEELSQEEKDRIRARVEALIKERGVEEILEQIAKVIADISLQLGVVLSPQFERGILHKIELVSLTERKFLLVLTIRSGLVKTMVMSVQSRIKPDEMAETARILNERLSGLTVGEIRRSIKDRMRSASRGASDLIRLFVEEAEELFDFATPENLHVGGTTHMLDQPEFRELRNIAPLMELLEERAPILDLLEERIDRESPYITIGAENSPDPMQVCSLLTSRYRVGNVAGVIGIMGPTRMPYSRLVALVTYMAELTSELLN